MTDLARAVPRNTAILAGCLTLSLAVWQLVGSLTPIAMERLAGSTEVVGLGMSVVVLASGLIALPAGRFMDRRGRVLGLCLGFAVGAIGAVVVSLATRVSSLPLFLAGLALLGAIFSGQHADESSLSGPWLLAAAILAVGTAFVWLIRVDPIVIARSLEPGRLGPRAAFAAACAAQLVMSSSMPLMGLVLHHRGYDLGVVSIAFGSHLFGMYALAPFVGRLTDAIGKVRALVVGLVVLASAVLGLTSEPVVAIAPLMFFVGVGWNVAYVSATAIVADGTVPAERGTALGAVDLVSVGAGALGSALSPALLTTLGLGAVVLLGASIALLRAAFIARVPAPAVARA